ncbi:hypothetical protein C8R45DRAFT_1109736 [Mycena sanguinolenta]|nr:hypothetical protein C8R45DRAFT_1109736 [Mycena sanguinolenta]
MARVLLALLSVVIVVQALPSASPSARLSNIACSELNIGVVSDSHQKQHKLNHPRCGISDPNLLASNSSLTAALNANTEILDSLLTLNTPPFPPPPSHRSCRGSKPPSRPSPKFMTGRLHQNPEPTCQPVPFVEPPHASSPLHSMVSIPLSEAAPTTALDETASFSTFAVSSFSIFTDPSFSMFEVPSFSTFAVPKATVPALYGQGGADDGGDD